MAVQMKVFCKHDLSGTEPETLTEMVASYETSAEWIGVVPWHRLDGKQE
ncbi:hypothetical protein CA85_21120 [Allorhodopirellula solitaria]|uniref:Uncharacterized protein n=1 Tax=Allorhodopirellula solitaria TaxID=2527987 RepID=A0A5C5Y0Z7_9BACT|nr:hypothetical protein CA85_21120 [Allorhodopirellula solitaria]